MAGWSARLSMCINPPPHSRPDIIFGPIKFIYVLFLIVRDGAGNDFVYTALSSMFQGNDYVAIFKPVLTRSRSLVVDGVGCLCA